MFDKPQQEHQWLSQLVGKWRMEQQCTMPDGKTNQSEGKMTCRSVGGLWLIAYVGTFLGSMMSHLWPYKGQLDPSRKRLPLDSTGPKFDGSGMANYRDTIEILSPDQWRFTGELQQDDGTWRAIMNSMHFRQ